MLLFCSCTSKNKFLLSVGLQRIHDLRRAVMNRNKVFFPFILYHRRSLSFTIFLLLFVLFVVYTLYYIGKLYNCSLEVSSGNAEVCDNCSPLIERHCGEGPFTYPIFLTMFVLFVTYLFLFLLQEKLGQRVRDGIIKAGPAVSVISDAQGVLKQG